MKNKSTEERINKYSKSLHFLDCFIVDDSDGSEFRSAVYDMYTLFNDYRYAVTKIDELNQEVEQLKNQHSRNDEIANLVRDIKYYLED